MLQESNVSLLLLCLLCNPHICFDFIECKTKVYPGIACDDVSTLQANTPLKVCESGVERNKMLLSFLLVTTHPLMDNHKCGTSLKVEGLDHNLR